MKAVTLLFAVLLCAGCVEKRPTPPPEIFKLGLNGFYCPTQHLIFAQAYMFAILHRPQIMEGCTTEGAGNFVTLISERRDGVAAEVELNGRRVWVLDVQLETTVTPPPSAAVVPLKVPTLLVPKDGLPQHKEYL